MTVNKAKVALGFIVAGALTLAFGGINLLIGPTVMTSQVIKVRCSLFCFWYIKIKYVFMHPFT